MIISGGMSIDVSLIVDYISKSGLTLQKFAKICQISYEELKNILLTAQCSMITALSISKSTGIDYNQLTFSVPYKLQ